MEPIDFVAVVLRAAAFIAALQAAGLTWFAASCRRAGVAAGPGLQGWVLASAGIALLLVLTHRAMDAGRLAGEWSGILDSNLQRMVWSRRSGLSTVVCALALLAVVVGAFKPGRWTHFGGVGGAPGVAVSFALTGHATEATHAIVLQGLLAGHVGLAAYWIGAVVGLYRLAGKSDLQTVARAAAGFSKTAVWLVPLLLPAGALLTWGLLPDLASLRTSYGGLLLLKVLGFCGLIALAAQNRLKLLPALTLEKPDARRVFRRVLLAEYCLICGVLAVTATMTSLFSWH